MVKILEKVERRLGEKLFLKGDRCVGPKCAVVRRGTPPGMHGAGGKGGRRRNRSEFGTLLAEKQKIRFLYGLDDKDIEKYSKKAVARGGIYSANLAALLESRLDNAVFRAGFADSRRMARFLVSHGHITVSGKSVRIPSYQIRKGDAIGAKQTSAAGPIFAKLEAKLEKVQTPVWIALDASKKTGTVIGIPQLEDMAFSVDLAKVKEFYSR